MVRSRVPDVDAQVLDRRRRPDLRVQASGGVSSLPDLAAARAIGCDGAIVGRALYEGRFTVTEALAA